MVRFNFSLKQLNSVLIKTSRDNCTIRNCRQTNRNTFLKLLYYDSFSVPGVLYVRDMVRGVRFWDQLLQLA